MSDLNSPLNQAMRYLRRTLAANPDVVAAPQIKDDVTILNIDVIDGYKMFLDLSDGTTIRLDVERYERSE